MTQQDMLKVAGALGMLRRGVGRVVTNLVRPVSYSGKLGELGSALLHPIESAKAVITDTPRYLKDPKAWERFGHAATPAEREEFARAIPVVGRDLPYRRMFGLPARFGREAYTKTGPNTFRFNPNSILGGEALDDVQNLRGDLHTGVPDLIRNELAPRHFIMGRYGREGIPTPSAAPWSMEDEWKRVMTVPDGVSSQRDVPKIPTKYTDRWDFDMHSGESPVMHPLRWAMSKLTNPVTIEGVKAAALRCHLPSIY